MKIKIDWSNIHTILSKMKECKDNSAEIETGLLNAYNANAYAMAEAREYDSNLGFNYNKLKSDFSILNNQIEELSDKLGEYLVAIDDILYETINANDYNLTNPNSVSKLWIATESPNICLQCAPPMRIMHKLRPRGALLAPARNLAPA